MSAFVVSSVHIDATPTAAPRLDPPYGATPLTWFWPAIDTASDRDGRTPDRARRQARQRRRTLSTRRAGRVGAMLSAENRRSVDHRHDEHEREEPHLSAPPPGVPDPVVTLKAVACHRHQSRG